VRPLPTFFLRSESTSALHLLHGSCRLLHGKGEDAFPAADEALARTVRDLAERPLGEANVGLVSVRQDQVVHRLLGRTGADETVTYTSTIDL